MSQELRDLLVFMLGKLDLLRVPKTVMMGRWNGPVYDQTAIDEILQLRGQVWLLLQKGRADDSHST